LSGGNAGSAALIEGPLRAGTASSSPARHMNDPRLDQRSIDISRFLSDIP
jgi:hypothetical protein